MSLRGVAEEWCEECEREPCACYDPYAPEPEAQGLALDGQALADYLDSLTEAERLKVAGRYPVRWLYPPMVGDPIRVLNLFCGCGGVCVGLRKVLGVVVDMVCIDINADAVASQRAAGCYAIQADVTTLDPGHPALRYTTGLICTPPCIDYTRAGKGAGNLPENIEILCNAFDECRLAGGIIPLAGDLGNFTSYKSPANLTWPEVREALEGYTGQTGHLMLEVSIWSLGLQLAGAPLKWVAVEQSSNLPEQIRCEIWCDFELAGWAMAEWHVKDAAENGSPSHRVRALMVARRDSVSNVGWDTPEPLETIASEAIGRPDDLEVITRGNRRTPGGNAFVMNRVIPCVTSKIRSFDVGEHGGRFTIEEIALLVTMPADFPVHGSRSAQCQQLADIVAPVIACTLLGVALGIEWLPHLVCYLAERYPHIYGRAEQPALAA